MFMTKLNNVLYGNFPANRTSAPPKTPAQGGAGNESPLARSTQHDAQISRTRDRSAREKLTQALEVGKRHAAAGNPLENLIRDGKFDEACSMIRKNADTGDAGTGGTDLIALAYSVQVSQEDAKKRENMVAMLAERIAPKAKELFPDMDEMEDWEN
jgi:hypothetical protein